MLAWVSLSDLYVSSSPPLEGTDIYGEGFFLLAMTILSIIYLICALRTNVVFVVIFATLVPALLCLLGAFWAWADDYTGNTLLAQRLCVVSCLI
jgi:hypothetical protein